MAGPGAAEQGGVFDLGMLAQELRQEAGYARSGHTARALVREPDLHVVLLVMKAGSRIAEHKVDQTAAVHTVEGRIRLHLLDRPVELPAGRLFPLARGLPHAVEAVEDSAFVLTRGK